MKLIRAASNQLWFQIGKREKRLLVDLLQLYPRIPPAHHRLSKAGRLPEPEGNQSLLEDALAEHRHENQQRLQAWVTDPKRFRETQAGWRLALSTTESEWLLQILNDIRVGSWVRLGSPEERMPAVTEETAPDFWAMEMAGYFQMRMLEALEGG